MILTIFLTAFFVALGIGLTLGVLYLCVMVFILPITMIYDRITSKLTKEQRKQNTQLMKAIKKKYFAETGKQMKLAHTVAAMELHKDYIDPKTGLTPNKETIQC